MYQKLSSFVFAVDLNKNTVVNICNVYSFIKNVFDLQILQNISNTYKHKASFSGLRYA